MPLGLPPALALLGAVWFAVPNARSPLRERAAAVDTSRIRPRTIPGSIGRLAVDIAAAERGVPANAYLVPSSGTGGPALTWLPDTRSNVPPPSTVVAPPPAALITLAPITFETRNRRVAPARGDEAMLMGLRATLPWMIP